MTNLGFYLFVFFLFLDGTLTQQRRSSKNSQASSTSASQVVDFDCPEEFGYYPHPADCTQYYVCVFGGALLESCTGGLMYSHELQTCDWPRNVGCGELVSTVTSAKAQEPRPRQPQPQQQLRSQQQQQQQHDQQQHDQRQHDQRQHEQRQQQPIQQFPPQRLLQRDEAIPKHHLYTEEDLGPAEEVESDRQQRVYRGQPATLGQVARDRDGLSRHSNALQVAPGNGREKLSVISFGTQQQYRTQSETEDEQSNDLAERKRREKRQTKFSFPGNTRTAHPSASVGATSWTAASPHFPPLATPQLPPPPPPSWPVYTAHYNQANKSPGISNNYNSPRNRQTFTPSKFSKPIRFPIQDNENDFVPILGQGVKLPKPSPGLLITPSSVDKENQPGTFQNKQHPHHLVSLASLENQPDNYVFFNLETSPNPYNKDNRPNQNGVNNSVVPFLLKIQLFQNQTHVINNFQNSNSTNEKDKANFNLSGFTLDSEKTQIASPNHNEDVNHKNYKNGEKVSEIKPVLNFNLAQLDSDKNVSHRDNVQNNFHNSPKHSQYYTDHGISEEYKDKDQTSKYEFEKDTLKSDKEGLQIPFPPKDLFEEQKYKYQNVNNPFSNPTFDFGKYFDELNDHSAPKNSSPSLQYSGHSLESGNDDDTVNTNRYKIKARKPNNFQQEENFNKSHPGLIKTIQYHPLTEEMLHEQGKRYRIQTQGIGNKFNSTTRNVPQTGVPIQPYFNKTSSEYNHYQSLINIPKPQELLSKEFENPSYQVTDTITGYSANTQNPLEDTIVDTYSNDVAIPSNHKYIENINIPPSYSFNFSDEFDDFKTTLSKHTTAHPFFNKDLQYNISDEEPAFLSAHRENSLSDPPHNKHKRSKQEDSLYDDEDYYGSDEDYYSDEFSIENLHSPVNKEVKPPDIPKKLNNIDFLTFDKSKLYDDYDEASIEDEDESERDDYVSSSSYNKGEVFDCNKYKNHKCNTTESVENYYDQSEGSEEYDYDEEDNDGENNKSTKPSNYAVVENIAESQQLFTKSFLKSDPANNKNYLPNSSGSITLNGSPFVNKPTNSLLSFPRTNLNKTSGMPPTLLTHQNNKLGEHIYQDVLLKTAPRGNGFYSTPVFSNGSSISSDRFKSLPKVIQRHNTTTHLRNITFRPNTAKLNKSLHMTTDSTKLHSFTTLPLIPKSLKHLRPLTLRTNFTPPQTGERSMTLVTFNSHLTKPLRVNGRQSIAPPYIEPTTTRVTVRGYNATQQQQYTPSPYDPYYNIYEDEADLYKDIDYSQYSGQQNQQYQKQSPVVQQQVQATPSRKPSVQYSPPPPQQSYNAVQQDVYSQSVGAHDYDNYNLQDEDIDYKQSDLDLKSNRSRSTKRQEAVKTPDGAEKQTQKQVQRNFPRNRHLTLTAAFSFEDEKFPVTSSKQLEENVRQRSNSFRVDEPRSSGPSRDTHELVLNYLRQENPTSTENPKIPDETKIKSEINRNRDSVNAESPKRDNQPKPFSYYLDDLDTSQISSTQPPKRDIKIEADFEHQSKSRPFRIIVPSSTSNPLRNTVTESDQVTAKPKYTIRRGNRYNHDNAETSTPAIETPAETVKPYKLPPLTRETIKSLPVQLSSQTTQESVENFRRAHQRNMEEQTSTTRRRLPNINNEFSKSIQEDNIQFIPVNPSRSLQEDSITLTKTHRFQNHSRNTDNTPKVINRQQAQLSIEKESPSKETNFSDLSSNLKSGRQTSTRNLSRQYSTASTTEESIFKFIPIQAVKSRDSYETSQNQETRSQKIQIDDLRPDVTTNTVQPRKIGNNLYQVTEESSDIESYTPLYHATKRKYHTHTTEEPTVTSRKSNIFSVEDIVIKENNKDSANDFSSTTRTPVRFFQTTEKVVPKPVYSLKIDSENNGQFGGFILATLETVTVPPVDSKSANNNVPNIRKTSSVEQKHTVGSDQDGNSGGKFQNEQQNSYYAIGNIQNNQIRIRNRVRPTTRNGFKNNNEYNAYSTSVEQSTEYNHDEQVTINTVRPRIRKPQDSSLNPSTESTPLNNINEQQKLHTGRRIIGSRTSTKINPSKDRNENGNDNEHLNIEVDSVADSESVKYNQRRGQLKNRNRLELITEEQGDRQESDNIDFNSEEENNFNNEEPSLGIESLRGDNDATDLHQRNTNFTLEAQFIPRRIKTFTSLPVTNRDEAATEAYDADSISDFAQDRQSNVRKMHIRKKVWKTTIQPQGTTDSYNIEDNSSTNRPYSDSGRRNNEQRPPFEPYFNNEIKSTTQTVRDTGSNGQDNLSSFKNRDEFVNDRNYHFKNNEDQYRGRGNAQFEKKENSHLKASRPTLGSVTVDPYELIKSSSNDNKSNRSRGYDQTTFTTQKPILRNGGTETRPTLESKQLSPLAMEINSYFKELVQNSTLTNSTDTKVSTTPYPMTTVERIRDKFRLGNFPKPTPPSSTFARKPSVEDITPPPLPSDRCSQELDNDSECNEKPLLRVRPTPASPDSQATPGLTRGNSRNRGSATYTVSPNEAEPAAPVNRGTPASISRNRPTLKPSTSVVSKASEYVDIYRYPPSRPEPIYPTPQVDKTAAKCRKDVCLLPDCSCGGKEIPGDLPPEQTPQIVLLTFDDSVNDLNKGLYSDLFEKGRTNPNGCPIAATFYVSHEWTDYSQVQNLYAGGHEIASHSVSHSFGEQFSVKKWTREIAGQREILSAYGGVKQEDIRGMRAPFLAVGGNKMFKMLYDSNFTYDSSMPVYENKPPSWPYTLDYKIFHDCMIPPCPTRSYPGVWEVPMVMWQDLNGGRCSMGDACSNPPTADGVYKMLVKNFERHFTSNRSPFGLFYHAAWFTQPHHKEGFIAFLDTITKMPEVWLLTNWQAIQWVRDPTPISRLNSFAPFQCNYPERPRRCNNPKVCNLWHKSGVRYMRTCQPCPDIYPWTGKTGVRNSRVDNEIITE